MVNQRRNKICIRLLIIPTIYCSPRHVVSEDEFDKIFNTLGEDLFQMQTTMQSTCNEAPDSATKKAKNSIKQWHQEDHTNTDEPTYQLTKKISDLFAFFYGERYLVKLE